MFCTQKGRILSILKCVSALHDCMYILNCKVKLLATIKKIKEDSLDDKKFNIHEVDSVL